MQEIIKSLIEEKIGKSIVLEKPKDIKLGHFATPVAFSLAKEYKKAPNIIASELASLFDNSSEFESVTAVNGFINFKLSLDFLEKLTTDALGDESTYAKGEKKDGTILLEFVSANPTGPLHIGHARGAIFGDALLKVGRYLGYDITSEYYINDAGAQIDLLGLSLYLAAKEYILHEDVVYPEAYYRGEYLIELANEACEIYGKEVFNDATKLDELVEFSKNKVIELIKKDLADIGITFDNFVSEKSLYNKWESTKEVLEKNNSLYEQDSRIWLRSSELGDEKDRVVVRENGVPTYLAGDIIYHKDKFDRGFEHYINIWGADHHGYIPRVKAAVSFLGYDSSKLEVLLSQMVSLLKDGEPYKMSKRAGNVILMSDITEEIGSDALRFIFLTRKSDTHLEFDINMLKNQDSSNPIFYINYAHARINQLFGKANLSTEQIKDFILSDEISQEAKDLLYEALLLPDILNESFNKRDFQKITDYLYNLSSSIHKFYNSQKIVEDIHQNSYLKVLAMCALSIRIGLKLLGINAKEKM
ncbi:arginine--tRNA ligase [Arcobacter sp. FWKO B]|uniref:arginine--tRNA ligase n=1 Tax=Arcobacter sp. FWKO B TaxID=2593672 RepID=UPI0018A49746|nr:arginine--tRNA ligase [Arcobacter sp. FWKO B]QOG11679.1 arginine--tRNA ligase [Arcobacter sp. FWKO B]